MATDVEIAKSLASSELSLAIAQLRTLVAIPSCAFPGYPQEPVSGCADTVLGMLLDAGITSAQRIDVEGGSPLIYAQLVRDANLPTVLLYAHYDVQPAPLEQGWDSDPWTLTERNGRLYGRGAADDKSGIVMVLGVLRALQKRTMPNVNIKILFEGEEEIGSMQLQRHINDHPDLVRCDAMLICDSGNTSTTEPSLTVSLRGLASCRIDITTSHMAGHSGVFGGPSPDALLALARVLASLHDEQGNVAIEGLHSYEWPDTIPVIDESQFRHDAGIVDGASLLGTGPLAQRLWAQPSVTATGIEAPGLDAPNSLVAKASAKISLRLAPGADPSRELDILVQHLRNHVPWGATCEITALELGSPYAVNTDHSLLRAARLALTDVFAAETSLVGIGGSIPLIAEFSGIAPSAAVILWGAEDFAQSRIHAANESVDPGEIERMIAATLLFLTRLAEHEAD